MKKTTGAMKSDYALHHAKAQRTNIPAAKRYGLFFSAEARP